jgi:hypothetical protein
VVAEFCRWSRGGAAASGLAWVGAGTAAASPWQALQAMLSTCSVPSTCLPPTRSMAPAAVTVCEWQALHLAAVIGAETTGWMPAGGKPWQAPHWTWVPSRVVQTGALAVPPTRVAPWQ